MKRNKKLNYYPNIPIKIQFFVEGSYSDPVIENSQGAEYKRKPRYWIRIQKKMIDLTSSELVLTLPPFYSPPPPWNWKTFWCPTAWCSAINSCCVKCYLAQKSKLIILIQTKNFEWKFFEDSSQAGIKSSKKNSSLSPTMRPDERKKRKVIAAWREREISSEKIVRLNVIFIFWKCRERQSDLEREKERKKEKKYYWSTIGEVREKGRSRERKPTRAKDIIRDNRGCSTRKRRENSFIPPDPCCWRWRICRRPSGPNT